MIKKEYLKRIIPLSLLAILGLTQLVSAGAPNLNADKLHKNARSFISQQDYSKANSYLLKAHKSNPTAAIKRDIADTYVALGKYEEAVPYYKGAANIYDNIGDSNAAIVLRNKAKSVKSTSEVFIKKMSYPSTNPLAKFEPRHGIYTGAFVEHDPNVRGDVAKLNDIMEKDHSMFFTYRSYGNPFPMAWAQKVKDEGAAVHLAFEPNSGLDFVKDDPYLREFARSAKEFGRPVFLRFASEMNGDWVNWGQDPTLYREKFKLVSRVMKEEAPNVAMVWIPNSIPIGNIDDYYPGDDVVDWVGVNMYNVKFFNGDINQPADHVNPNELFKYVYDTYSHKKPLMIGEYGATHFSKAGNMDTTQLAVSKMRMLYEGVQLKYPRIKAINWFSNNTIKHAHSPERKLNNFTLTENEKVKNTYKEIIKDDYFLENVVNGPGGEKQVEASQSVYKPMENLESISGLVEGASWVETYDPYISKVVYKINNNSYLSESTVFPYKFTLDTSKLAKGKNTLNVISFDSKGKVASRKNIDFNVK